MKQATLRRIVSAQRTASDKDEEPDDLVKDASSVDTAGTDKNDDWSAMATPDPAFYLKGLPEAPDDNHKG